jgi:hypothetical protein
MQNPGKSNDAIGAVNSLVGHRRAYLHSTRLQRLASDTSLVPFYPPTEFAHRVSGACSRTGLVPVGEVCMCRAATACVDSDVMATHTESW